MLATTNNTCHGRSIEIRIPHDKDVGAKVSGCAHGAGGPEDGRQQQPVGCGLAAPFQARYEERIRGSSIWYCDLRFSISGTSVLTINAELPPSVSEEDPAKHDISSPPLPQVKPTEPTPPQSPIEPTPPQAAKIRDHHEDVAPHEKVQAPQTNVTAPSPVAPSNKSPLVTSTPSPAQNKPTRPQLGSRGNSNDESKSKGPLGGLKSDKGGRRSSWISSISSKFSSSNTTPTQRNLSGDAQKVVSPKPSPAAEFSNPFDSSTPVANKDGKDPKKEEPKKEEKKIVYAPRRQSVLVAAGKETQVGQQQGHGFLSSLRRLSSSSNANMGKNGGNMGAICPRRTMNVDQNRDRIRIEEFEQNKLKRVAFCVDVEIAGYAAQGDEEDEAGMQPPTNSNTGARGSLSAPSTKRDSKDAKYKEKGEGAALKNPNVSTAQKEEQGQTEVDAAAENEHREDGLKNASKSKEEEQSESQDLQGPDQPQPTTRKKEKKKRSEEERKARKEKKKRHAEKNGLVPLELTREDDDSSDSSPSSSQSGTATPKKGLSPTTDPLRIYKRCCQLRETTALKPIKEQIAQPAAILAEAPGTVAVIDLSGQQMKLEDVVTLGDWLAVVPVRKLVLDNCSLGDEAVRVILSGLSGCKSAEQTKANRKLSSKVTGSKGHEQMGVIEKLSMKNNSAITAVGWKHIALFLHISKSLKGVDLSGIPFPKGADLSRTTTRSSTESNTNGESNGQSNGQNTKTNDLGALIARAIVERLGDKLEELILTHCALDTKNVSDLVDCSTKRKIKRLGLAENKLEQDGMSHVLRYLRSGVCEGLDLGGNDLHKTAQLLASVIDGDSENPLFAMSLANCRLTPDDLAIILKPFSKLKNLKFIDLSGNRDLFSGSTNAVTVFRKLLPKFQSLKRVHLSDCGLVTDHVIALSEILPDCPALAHVTILDNEQLVRTMNSKDGAEQEEACALFASLMTAVRVSQTLVAIEIEVPSSDSSEVVKALASQVVAYSLRNMERSALDEFGVKSDSMPGKDAPGVLLHMVGNFEDGSHEDEPAPDENYVIASTGIVKALGVCLGTMDTNSRTHTPRNASPNASGISTPRQGLLKKYPKKPRDVSLELCESARKIRMRLRPALVKMDKAGDDLEFRESFHHPSHRMVLIVDRSIVFPGPDARTHDIPFRGGIPRNQDHEPTHNRTKTT